VLLHLARRCLRRRARTRLCHIHRRTRVQLLENLEGLTAGARTEQLPALDALLHVQRLGLQPPSKPPGGEFSWDAKRKLAISIANFNMDHASGLVEVVRSCHSLPDEGEGPLRIDLDALPHEALRKVAVRC
jgi:hypothetical protein